MLNVNSRIRLPSDELKFTFVRSSGPGGQNVNKVNSKAVLRWSVRSSPSVPEDVRERFVARYYRRITVEGDVLITSQRYRDQARNAADCREKLREMLASVATAPVRRKRTRPTRSSVERRLKKKRGRAQKKEGRRGWTSDEHF